MVSRETLDVPVPRLSEWSSFALLGAMAAIAAVASREILFLRNLGTTWPVPAWQACQGWSQLRQLAFQGISFLTILATVAMLGVLGWRAVFKALKPLVPDSGNLRTQTRSARAFVPFIAGAVAAIVLGYCLGSLLWEVWPKGEPPAACGSSEVLGIFSEPEGLWGKWFVLGVLLSFVLVVTGGYILDLAQRNRHRERMTAKGTAVEARFSTAASYYYWALVVTVAVLWGAAVTLLASNSIEPYVRTPTDYLRLVGFFVAYLVLEALIAGALYLVCRTLRRRRFHEKRSHQTERLLILIAPSSSVLVLTTLGDLLLLQHIVPMKRDIFFHLTLVGFEAIPLTLLSPLVVLATLTRAAPATSRNPWRDSVRAAMLFTFHVIHAHRVLFTMSFLFSLLILLRWPDERLPDIALFHLQLVTASAWLVPIVHAILSFEATCFNAYTDGLRRSFRVLNHHFIVGGFGDFGQRVAQAVTRKAALDDPMGLRTHFDGVDIILPDGRLEKLWAGIVVVDKEPNRFHYLTTLENGLQCGIAYIAPLSAPDAPPVLVPALVGDISHREVMTTVALSQATFFSCLARDNSAPLTIVQTIVRMGEESSRHPQPRAVARVPVTVVGVANQSQYDSVLSDVRQHDLPVHAIYSPQLEGIHFAGRLYAYFKKFRDETGRCPRILVVGRGKHIALSLDSFFRYMMARELEIFTGDHRESPRLAILSDHPPLLAASGPPDRRVRKGVVTFEKRFPGHRADNLLAYRARGLWKNPLECRPGSAVPKVDVEIPVFAYSPLDWEPLIKVTEQYEPDLVALIDYQYIHQHATLGNLLSAMRRCRQYPSAERKAWLPVPEVIVCRENGPSVGIRRQLNRMLFEYCRMLARSVQFTEDTGIRARQQAYMRKFPSLPSLEDCEAIARKGPDIFASVEAAISDIVVDVLDECVSRVVSLADTRLPKGRPPDPTIELNFCLPEATGALARFWAMGLGGRASYAGDRNNLFRNRLLLNFIHLEEDLQEPRVDSHPGVFVGKSYAYLPSAGEAGLVGDEGITGCRVRIASHGFKGPRAGKLREVEDFVRDNLKSVIDLNRGWTERHRPRGPGRQSSWHPDDWGQYCPATHYCGLDTLARQDYYMDLPEGRKLFDHPFTVRSARTGVETPFAYLEMRGPNLPGKAAEALTALQCRRLSKEPIASMSSSGLRLVPNAMFLSDYQCSSERHSRVLMFVRFESGDDLWTPSGCLNEVIVRPVTGHRSWREYLESLRIFLSEADGLRWRLDERDGTMRLIPDHAAGDPGAA